MCSRLKMESYSQVGQDYFAYKILLENKDPYVGYFIDVASGDPVKGNNTYSLEKNYGWKGLLVDYNKDFEEHTKNKRKSVFLCEDAIKLNWLEKIKEYNMPKTIDYLSFDLDDNSVSAICNIPFDEIEFKVMTVEHDSYRLGDFPKTTMRNILKEKGYQLVCEDVKEEHDNNFEDWWVNPKYISQETIEKYKCKNEYYYNILGKYHKNY